ncbi:phosphosulfolactate synthase [Peribacillus deserti]|uniref:Phosphosulfolactate synthase n=1 Tax=Peribacillus deserti TaxID=673318 RepID=A0A2N5M850_9BACI|nr:phosphosulfolactate synthase [Peribacillus deserti]PLT30526.1 phosphosulfolactate synthase [Peribacillus deserti]
MNIEGLHLPERICKPRKHGITILIDNGVPFNLFKDTIASAGPYIDFIKFGWGTSIITSCLEQKISFLDENNVDFFFGGTLFEKFLSQKKVDEYYNFCKRYGSAFVEISNGTIDIPNREKARFIEEFSKDFIVFSEVGHKDSVISNTLHSEDWVQFIQEDLEAGAYKVITEARESGTSGLCDEKGEMRFDIVGRIREAGISLANIIFEAPNKKLQTSFIKLAGPNVNLANIPFTDPISLETLRLGLRSDTFYTFHEGEYE